MSRHPQEKITLAERLLPVVINAHSMNPALKELENAVISVLLNDLVDVAVNDIVNESLVGGIKPGGDGFDIPSRVVAGGGGNDLGRGLGDFNAMLESDLRHGITPGFRGDSSALSGGEMPDGVRLFTDESSEVKP